MNQVWDRHPTTSAEVLESLPPGTAWKQKTVNTFLTRLVQKGVLSVTKQGNVNVYAPILRREECIASESATFLQRVFQGAAGPLLLHFCDRVDLSEDEIQELQKRLREKKGRP